MRVPIAVDIVFDEDRRLYMPWRMFRGQESVYLYEPRLERHSRVGRTVYLHYSAIGYEGRYALTVSLDDRQWLLMDIVEEPDPIRPAQAADVRRAGHHARA